MLILTAIITPIRVCLVDEKDAKNWFVVELIFDIYFWIDIVINFISAYIDNNNKRITKWSEIIKNYLTGWFIIDFVAVFRFQ